MTRTQNFIKKSVLRTLLMLLESDSVCPLSSPNAERKRLVSPQGRRNERQGITISDKIELAHFVVCSGEAKPKISFTFLSAPPTPPAEEKKKGKEHFWFLLPRPQGADEACRLERTIQSKATTRSAREISSFRQGSARNAVELCLIHTALSPRKRRRAGTCVPACEI